MNNTAAAANTDRLELLQTFVRIVEAGNLSIAAEQMGTSQPTVSRRLQALERSLRVRLLQRSTHAMKLTADGERCFAYAKALLENWQTMESDLRGTRDAPQGLLRVVAPHAFGQNQLIAPLAGFLRRHPGVSVEWLLHDRLPDFIAEGIDCAIHIGPVDEPGLVAVRLAEVPRIVVATPGLWGQGPAPRTPRELAALPWLALRTFYRDEVELMDETGRAAAERFAIRPRLSTDNLLALRNAVLAGLGAGIASAWAVERDIAGQRLVRLAPGWGARPLPVSLAYPHARFYPARLRAFVECMRAAMPGLAGMRQPQAEPRAARYSNKESA